MEAQIPVLNFAPIRNRIFSLGFQAQKHSLSEAPRFSLIDVGLVPKLGWKRSVKFFRNFEAYRNNISDKNWSCLTSFYPRSYYLFYYYLLFWWADYCNVLRDIVESPKPSLVAELFFRYIVEVDRVIDDSMNGNKMLMNPSLIKRNPEISWYLSAFLNYLGQTDNRSQIKRQICKSFWNYRNKCLIACQDTHLRSDAGLEQILLCKQITVEGLFLNWSSILGRLYCPASSQNLVENAGIVLSKACMAMQIHEDQLDFPADFRGGILNIFHEILKIHPQELRICKAYVDTIPWQHLDGIWARQNLPASCNMAQELVHRYLKVSLEESLIRQKAIYLYQMLGNINSHPIGI